MPKNRANHLINFFKAIKFVGQLASSIHSILLSKQKIAYCSILTCLNANRLTLK
jgi:ribosomal protein L13